MKELNEGAKAPTFKELSENKGKMIVLYFYPKDDTPGCTTEACELRDAHKRIEARTASAWPAGFTLWKIFLMVPSEAMIKVVRSTPMYFLPYMDFSFHTPYAPQIL